MGSAGTGEVPPRQLRDRMLRERRIIAVGDPGGAPADAVPGEAVKREVLDRHFRACGELLPRGARVVVYVRDDDARDDDARCPAAPSPPARP
ncbi:hypothetical protein G3I40_41085 [Streptomyces sp. SID14478]|uniref:hypothetical protein n=1 Tax=Streptomyces sp. SID14478 TaxID=2706073 RepID=UPI0013DF76B6|nr:hypothetical protein [Streptomyces sp. SID14478]NEB81563.1 hypothetical protein [Streptomyces sp. SID14478]